MSMFERIGFGFVLLLSALAASCSSETDDSSKTFSCSTAKSKCAGDRAPTSEEIQSCDKALADPKCGNLVTVALLCLAQHQTCAADGTTDQDKTAAQCPSEVSAVDNCFDTGDAGTQG
jgi:hypothetical protein